MDFIPGEFKLRFNDLSIDDLHTILYWYSKAFENKTDETGLNKNTLIKVQAMAIYAQEEDESSSRNSYRRRMR